MPTPNPVASVDRSDAIDWLRGLPDASVDLLLTDPPYESLEKHRRVGSTPRLKDWFPIFPNSRFPQLLSEAFRVLKNGRHFYMFCDSTTMFAIKPMIEDAGFKFWKPLVWDKVTIGMGYHYRARSEFILFSEKGKRKLASLSVADVLSYPRVRGGYPTEKPVELLEVLVNQSTERGELVCDPFCGSGATGVACARTGRDFAGTDIQPRAVAISRDRLEEAGARVVERQAPPVEEPRERQLQLC